MSCPKLELKNKTVILLSGFTREPLNKRSINIKDKSKLEDAAAENKDAVAFGYVCGKWHPAA